MKHRATLFNFLKEISFLNNKALFVEYPDGDNSFDIMHYFSKTLPRKQKKRLRTLIRKYNETH